MTSISSVTTQVFSSAGTEITGNAPAAAGSETQNANGSGQAIRIDGPRLSPAGETNKAGKANGAGNGDSSNDSDTVKALKKQIEILQKQLTEQLRQLKALQASKMEERAKASAVLTLQGQIAGTSAALQTMMNKLADVLKKELGDASGSMVNTTA